VFGGGVAAAARREAPPPPAPQKPTQQVRIDTGRRSGLGLFALVTLIVTRQLVTCVWEREREREREVEGCVLWGFVGSGLFRFVYEKIIIHD
jgi:hypothetical protein